MSRAYVLMTAMPPTKGHQALIEFARHVGETAEVILCTQPDEPYIWERLNALRKAFVGLNVNLHHVHRELPQEPEQATGFWDMWSGILLSFGLQKSDFIVASERYGLKLAEVTGATFIPYDIDRDILWTKATEVRDDPRGNFAQMLPEFQKNLLQTVTIFGAESTGKTTLSRSLARHLNGHWLPEWARPYLEHSGAQLTNRSMTDIWTGQKALQQYGRDLKDKPFVFQDTDLFSTLGYWDMKGWNIPTYEEGRICGASPTPYGLERDAVEHQSDLYLITRSNIPFEPDPLRYGGDKREGSDEYWIRICARHSLNFRVLEASSTLGRIDEAMELINEHYEDTVKLAYRRITKEDFPADPVSVGV